MSQVPEQPPPGLAQPGAPGTGVTGAGAVPAGRASFWQRLAAVLIDGILLSIVGTILGAAFGGNVYTDPNPAASGLNFLIGLAYYVYLHGSPSGQTIGKKAMKIRVLGADDGDPIGYGRAALRYLGSILSAIPCFLGYFWMLWDDNKQTWHDKIATTIVVPESDAPVANWPG